MQTFSPKTVAPDLSPALKTEAINNSLVQQVGQLSYRELSQAKNSRQMALKTKKMTVQVEKGK